MALVLAFGVVLPVTALADIALFTVLFTDGQRANVRALREGWRLSGRALGLGMPLTMIGIAVPAHFLVGLDWPTALLLGAILSPTDPAIVGRDHVPLRLRRLLNVESGLNDGLALPFVLIFLATAAHADSDLGKDPGHSEALWWSLALGADFGGNMTAIGASANVVLLGIAARSGSPISFWEFTRKGAQVTLLTVLIAAPYLWLRYFVLG